MSFRSKEMVKKIIKKLGAEKSLTPAAKVQIQKFEPDTKMVMGRAHRSFFAGRHIQFGNRVSEKGGNKSVLSLYSPSPILFIRSAFS